MCEREKCFSVLRKPLSLCPGSLCAVLGSSVPVWSLRLHAWRSVVADVSHGQEGEVTLVWSCRLLCSAVASPCERSWAESESWGSHRTWSSSPQGPTAGFLEFRGNSAKFRRGRAVVAYQAMGKRPCTGFWGPPGCCRGRKRCLGRSHCSRAG